MKTKEIKEREKLKYLRQKQRKKRDEGTSVLEMKKRERRDCYKVSTGGGER